MVLQKAVGECQISESNNNDAQKNKCSDRSLSCHKRICELFPMVYFILFPAVAFHTCHQHHVLSGFAARLFVTQTQRGGFMAWMSFTPLQHLFQGRNTMSPKVLCDWLMNVHSSAPTALNTDILAFSLPVVLRFFI